MCVRVCACASVSVCEKRERQIIKNRVLPVKALYAHVSVCLMLQYVGKNESDMTDCLR